MKLELKQTQHNQIPTKESEYDRLKYAYEGVKNIFGEKEAKQALRNYFSTRH